LPEDQRPLGDDLLNELTPGEWRLVVSLVEAIATSDEGECPICHRQVDRSNLAEHMTACRDFSTVRIHRLEVVDRNGRLVLVVGELDRPRADPAVGVALIDARTGAERAVLALNADGPHLEAMAEGNVVAAFGVNDPGGEVLPGVYLVPAGFDGARALGWSVDPDGLVTVQGGTERRAPTMTAKARIISIRFPADEHELLRWYARLTGSSSNAEVVKATRRHLAAVVDAERLERYWTEGRSTAEELLARVSERWRANGVG
jgi:uncharacterized protein (DUF1778 family)